MTMIALAGRMRFLPVRWADPPAGSTENLWHDVDCVEHVLATLPTRAP